MKTDSVFHMEIERLAEAHLCECCGELFLDESLVVGYRECRIKRLGYVFKHRKLWRLCPGCWSRDGRDLWVIPSIKRLIPSFDLAEIVAVQPMNLPTADVFYLDFHTAEP